jgi:hypothetical protein
MRDDRSFFDVIVGDGPRLLIASAIFLLAIGAIHPHLLPLIAHDRADFGGTGGFSTAIAGTFFARP